MGRPKKRAAGKGAAKAAKAVGSAAVNGPPPVQAQPKEKPKAPPKEVAAPPPKERPKAPAKVEARKPREDGAAVRVRPKAETIGDGPVSSVLMQALKMRAESASELARSAGVNPRSVQRFVSGERDLSLAAVDRLAQVLGLRLVSSTPIPSAPADS